MTPRAYIAAPWWHPSPAHREWNTRRAELLARLAAAEAALAERDKEIISLRGQLQRKRSVDNLY